MNCAVFGSLLIPVKHLRRKKVMTDVNLKLLTPNDDAEAATIENPPNKVKGNSEHGQEQSNTNSPTTENQVWAFILMLLHLSKSLTCITDNN